MKKTLTLLAAAVLVVAAFQAGAAVSHSSTDTPIGPFGGAANCANTTNGLGGIASTIAFAETGTITDVNVRVEITHTWRSDLQFSVTYTGGGGTVTLAGNPDHDGSGDDYYATFDDEAGTACSVACAATGVGPCSAPSAPGPTCSPNQALSAFDGLASPGTWTLAVCDDAGGDSGTLQLWELTVNGMAGDGLPVELVGFGVE